MKIKFSHKYLKFPPNFEKSQLLDVLVLADIAELNPAFRDWDTAIVGGGNYPLPKHGKYMILLLVTAGGRLWTTIRRWTPEKVAYYSAHTGQVFDCVIEGAKEK